MKYKILKNWQIYILAALSLIILISHTFYVIKTHQYPEMDEHLYINMASEYYRLLQNPSWDVFAKINQFAVDHPPFRPPAYPLSITGFIFIFGIENSYKLGLWINGIYYVITIIALYFLARHFLSKTASLLSSILFAFYGWPLFYLHFTYSETATTAFVVLCLLFLVKSNKFQDTKYSILFGIFLSLGIFVRWVVPLFVVCPALLVFIQFLRQVKKKPGLFIQNLLLIFLILIPTVLYHVINSSSFFGNYISSQLFYSSLWELVPDYRRSLVSFQSAAYYFKVFEQLGIVFFITFILGLVISLVKRKKFTFLFIAFLVPYFFFSFGTVIKDDRYIVPIYPIIALISAVVIESVKHKKVKNVVLISLMILSFGSFFGSVWAVGPMGKEGLKSILLPMPIGHQRRIHLTSIVWPPTKNFSNAEIIMKILDDDIKKNNIRYPSVLNLFSYHPVENAIFAINNYQRIKPLNFQNLIGWGVEDPVTSSNSVKNLLKETDYIIVKNSGELTDNYYKENDYKLLKAANRAMLFCQDDLLLKFKTIKEISIPLDN